jgi:type II/III secretion system protein
LDRRGVSAGLAVAAAVTGGAATACVPPSWSAKVLAIARARGDLTGIASNSILELARGATEVTMTRTRLLTAAAVLAVLAGGTATALIPYADAQIPTTPAPPPPVPVAAAPALPAAPVLEEDAPAARPVGGATAATPVNPYPGMPGRPATTPRSQWEYKTVPCSRDSFEEFRRSLDEHGAAGWEYCGPAPVTSNNSVLILVFKRELGAGQSRAGVMPPPTYTAPAQNVNPRGEAPGMPGASSYFPKIPAPLTGSASGTAPKGGEGMPKYITPKGPAEREATIVQLSYARAEEVANLVKELFAEGGGRVTFDSRTNSVILLGDERNVGKIERLIKKLDKAPSDGNLAK